VTAVVIVLAFVVALLAFLVVGLLKSHADILRALHDLGVNLDEEHGPDHTFRLRETSGSAPPTAAPSAVPPPGLVEAHRPVDDPASLGSAHDLAGETPSGEAAVVGVVGASDPTLLAFLSSGCLTCQEFWAAFAEGVGLELDGRQVRIVAVTKGSEQESPGAVAQLAPPDITTIMSTEAYDDYGVPVSPYFVLVEAHGGAIAGEGAAASWPQLASLLDRAVTDASAAGGQRTRRELLAGARRNGRVDRELLPDTTAAGRPDPFDS
jgi:hypothetical protein